MPLLHIGTYVAIRNHESFRGDTPMRYNKALKVLLDIVRKALCVCVTFFKKWAFFSLNLNETF